LLDKAVDILVEGAKIEYPNALLDRELESALERHDRALRQQGLDLENYLKVLKITREQYKEQQRPEVIQSLRRSLALGKLAELERLRVEADEVNEEIESRIEPYEKISEESSNQLRDLLHTPAGLRYITTEVLTQKAYQRLLDIVKGKALPLEPAAEAAPAASSDQPEVEAGEATATVEETAPAASSDQPAMEAGETTAAAEVAS